jgi:peptide/nickel transport system substrate-binding protein
MGDGERPGPVGEQKLSRRHFVQGSAAFLTLSGALAACGGSSTSGTTKATGKPIRGGVLRVGMVGEPPTADLNPWIIGGVMPFARIHQMHERLADQGPADKPGTIVPMLATSWEPDKTGKVWTIKLREGVTWHDGKPFTADDVIYSFRTILDPKKATQPGPALATVLTADGMKKVDPHTIEFTLKVPYATFQNILALNLFIAQDGWSDWTPKARPPGTGPFKLTGYQPGVRTVLERNPRYWREGEPYVDRVEIVQIADGNARLNALRSGQIHIAQSLTAPQAKQLESGSGGIKALISEPTHWPAMVMAVSKPPFTDPRVRQAFKYIMDRDEILQRAVVGLGRVGNDLIAPTDPLYAKSLPQYKQDLDKAKFLLKQAGQANLKVTLNSSNIATGVSETALVFARQAQQAGVTVKVNNQPAETYFAEQGTYRRSAFFFDENGDYNIDTGYSLFLTKGGVFNATEWNNKKSDSLVAQALGELDEAKRRDLWLEVQQMQLTDGGYLIPFFSSFLDAYSTKVANFKPHWKRDLGWFRFREVWLT